MISGPALAHHWVCDTPAQQWVEGGGKKKGLWGRQEPGICRETVGDAEGWGWGDAVTNQSGQSETVSLTPADSKTSQSAFKYPGLQK